MVCALVCAQGVDSIYSRSLLLSSPQFCNQLWSTTTTAVCYSDQNIVDPLLLLLLSESSSWTTICSVSYPPTISQYRLLPWRVLCRRPHQVTRSDVILTSSSFIQWPKSILCWTLTSCSWWSWRRSCWRWTMLTHDIKVWRSMVIWEVHWRLSIVMLLSLFTHSLKALILWLCFNCHIWRSFIRWNNITS